jgi:hypothetical protein
MEVVEIELHPMEVVEIELHPRIPLHKWISPPLALYGVDKGGATPIASSVWADVVKPPLHR